jgi:hypothetical protein
VLPVATGDKWSGLANGRNKPRAQKPLALWTSSATPAAVTLTAAPSRVGQAVDTTKSRVGRTAGPSMGGPDPVDQGVAGESLRRNVGRTTLVT